MWESDASLVRRVRTAHDSEVDTFTVTFSDGTTEDIAAGSKTEARTAAQELAVRFPEFLGCEPAATGVAGEVDA